MEGVFESESEEQTLAFGRRLGSLLVRGDVVGIRGELGAGKSVVVRGICEGLGIRQRTRSPSFTFVNRYGGPVDVYHVDLYRVAETADLATLGWEDAVYSDAVTLIEWAEKLGALMPQASIRIDIDVTGEESRRIRLSSPGKNHEDIVRKVLCDRG
ncbi:MAG: tRNA (adenosine(37)-N6)-threonylcarbamoyltransferase complex ATPase subunit type 1 TsaE [Candidatus Eiseniibacteriota bacterium]|nr:MAG: tRNA (adenosine(37)-N6)-threonylcarbamoyltransferase complex ATPase subunit type 1 TsaE [Candidatus Eisenbacteria bacterium]